MSDAGYQAAILDVDGTVYRGDQLIPGADRGVRALREAGATVLFLSNKAFESRSVHTRTLQDFGFDVTEDDIVSSGWVTAQHVAEHYPDSEVFVIGEPPLLEEFRAVGVDATRDAPGDLLVASMDREFSYEKLKLAMETLADGGPFLATNPDRTCPTEDGEIPDAAGMIGAVEGVTGRELDAVLGKPSEVMVETAMTKVGADPPECLLVGDRLETDIRMGNQAGMTTVLVLSGVTDRETLARSSIQPDHVIESMASIDEVLRA